MDALDRAIKALQKSLSENKDKVRKDLDEMRAKSNGGDMYTNSIALDIIEPQAMSTPEFDILTDYLIKNSNNPCGEISLNETDMKEQKTIAQQLNIKEFPFIIKDKQNNIIYFEYSSGFWYKQEFDENNNIIYLKNSDGYWFKKEFDKSGKQIYYEDSKVNFIDNRPKPPTLNNKVFEIDGRKYKLTEI